MPPDVAARTRPRALTATDDAAMRLTAAASGTAQTKLRALAASAFGSRCPARERVDAPGAAGDDHQRAADRIGPADRRERQPREPRRRQRDAGPAAKRRGARPPAMPRPIIVICTAPNSSSAPAAAPIAHVRERERRRVREQRDRTDQAPARLREATARCWTRTSAASTIAPAASRTVVNVAASICAAAQREPRQDRVRRRTRQRERREQRGHREGATWPARDGTALAARRAANVRAAHSRRASSRAPR